MSEQDSGELDGAFEGEVSVGYVLVPVVVRGKGGFSERLGERDFKLSVDGQTLPIGSFESGAQAPIGLLILQDLSGSMGIGPKLAHSRSLIECLMGHSRMGDEFAVASFSNAGLFIDVPFPGSLQAIRDSTSAWDAYGRTALHDAVGWLPDIVAARSSPRRAVVLITDGVDNASKLGATESRDQMRQAQVPVHVVGLDAGSFERLDREGKKLYRLADMLNLIGWATGGGYHPISDPGDLVPACNSIVEDLRHQYVLGFSTRADGGTGRHEITVDVPGKSRKLEIKHRQSYEGTDPSRLGSQ